MFDVDPAAEDVLAEVALGVGLAHRPGDPADRVHGLTADVDERLAGPHRVAGDDDALDHRVRVVHHDRQVPAGAGLALVGVDDHVVRLAGLAGLRLRDELPLQPGREPGPAAAAQVRILDHRDDRVGIHRQGLAQAAVAVQRLVVVDLPRLVGTEPLGENRSQRHVRLSTVRGRTVARRRLTAAHCQPNTGFGLRAGGLGLERFGPLVEEPGDLALDLLERAQRSTA